MAIDIPLELDSGPITWVKAEIDSALYRALDGIAKLRAAPSAAVRDGVRADLHRVAGAFELVGIEGLAVLVQEFERHFGADVEVVGPQSLDLIDRGCRRLLSHLKEMESGSPPVPLRLIPEYLALGKLRNAKFGPADLFFPDLSRRPTKLHDAVPPEPSRMPMFLLRQRRDFQTGLLQWLRGSDAGLDQMRRVVSEIEAAYPLPSQRSFWWSVHALLVATQTGMVEPSTALKQLLARIDLQMRRFVEGSTRVADRLRREVLYHVARSRNGNPLVDEVKLLYELDVLVPKRVPREIDVVSLQPAIDALNAIVTRCKDAWTGFNAGRANAFGKLREATAELPAACDALHMVEFSNLGRGIAAAAQTVAEGKAVGDDLSIEFATSLILIETAVEHIAALPSSFRGQVDRALRRLQHAASNAPIPVELRAEVEDNSLTRLAQERQTVSQVAREIRANMRLVEQALDAVFRDRGAIEELKPVPALLGQVSGAMRMLGWNDANELLTKTSDRLIDAVRSESELSAQDIDSLADVLAGLSFYIDVRERRDRDADQVLAGLKRRFLGGTEVGAEADSDDSEESVESSLAERQRMLRPLARAIHEQPELEGLRDTLRSTLQGVRQDAELLSDAGLTQASSEALRLLDHDDGHAEALTAAVAAVVGGTAAIPPTSEETSRLVESQPDERDSALLDIFVEEATEVVTTIRDNYALLQAQHGRRDLLVDIRRAFHTLKGSGRMVGQTDLAEVAWRVERVLNEAIEEDRPPSEAELRLIGAASEAFTGWVGVLHDHGSVSVEVGALDTWLDACGHRPAPTPKAEVAPSAPPAATVAGAMSLAPEEPLYDSVLPLIEVDMEPEHPEVQHFAQPLPSSPPSANDSSVAPVASLTIAPEAVTPSFAADELNVRGVPVSRALFSILTDETRLHLQTLESELALLQFDPSLLPSDDMVRASHTLCGIHRTAGFRDIGDFAGLLESALVALRRSEMTAQTLPTLAAAIQCLRTATLRLQAQSPLTPEETAEEDEARARLRALMAETGAREIGGVEVELLERSHAEDHAPSAPVTTAAGASEFDTSFPPIDVAPAVASAAVPTTAAPIEVLFDEPTLDDVAATAPEVPANVQLSAQPEHPPAPLPASEPVLTQPDLRHTDGADSPASEPPSHLGEFALGAAATTTAAFVAATAPTIATTSWIAPQPAPQPLWRTPEPSPAPDRAPVSAASAAPVTAPTGAAVLLTTPSLHGAAASAAMLTPASAPVSTAAQEDPLADVRDDIDEQVLPIFLEEAQELYPRASEQVSGWRRQPTDSSFSDGLKRTLHTLKGSARMAGAMRLGELAHRFETRLLEVGGEPTPVVFDAFDESLDDIAFLLERLTHGERDAVLPRYQAKPEPVAETAGDAITETVAPVSVSPEVPGAPAVAAERTSVSELAQRLAVKPVTAVHATVTAGEAVAAGFLRVRSDSVESLADEAGEIAIARSRIEAEMRNLKAGLLDLTASVVRLRTQLREIEIQGESQIQSRLDQESQFDPLEFDRYTRFQELTRGLAEGVNDVATVQQSLLKSLADAENALSVQTRLSRSVQLRLQTLRTVPFTNISDRLYRTLRQTAKDLKKRANLDIRGGRIEIDRSVLERLTPVLEHLVRNALVHGIESEAVRHDLGKPEIGEITLSVRQQGNEVVMSLADDGGGVAFDKVRERAIALGLLDASQPASQAELLEFIFQPGFSTADTVTAVAGRGIGTDVVRNEVTALGGRVEAHSVDGMGTTFTLAVPLTLAVTQVLLVSVGKTTFGVPSSIIEQVRQIPGRERAAAAASGQLLHGGEQLAFRSLGAMTRLPHAPRELRTGPVMVLRSGDLRVAIEVDHIVGNQEVVAKPYGPQLARVPGLAGLTVLADGTITLLLNPINLMLAQEARPALQRQAGVTVAPVPTVSATASTPLVTPPSAAEVPSSAVIEAGAETASSSAADALVAASVPSIDELAPTIDHPLEPTLEAADVVAFAPTPTVEPLATPAMAETHAVNDALGPLDEPPQTVQPRAPLVLVVDDSLTVRKITTRLLEREGYRALTAKDGLDALQVLADHNPDVILLDIEMPRMDGFEFTKTIKADDRQNRIPIIMITSRTAEKHRSHAQELGVDEYLGKPYQDDQLLELIAKHAGKPT